MDPSGKCVLLLTNSSGNKIAKIIDKIGQTVRTYEKIDNVMNNTIDDEMKKKHEDDNDEKFTKKKLQPCNTETLNSKSISSKILSINELKNSNSNNLQENIDFHVSNSSNNNNSNKNNSNSNSDNNNNGNNNDNNNDKNNNSNKITIGRRKTETHVWNHEDLKMEFQPETWEVSLVVIFKFLFPNCFTFLLISYLLEIFLCCNLTLPESRNKDNFLLRIIKIRIIFINFVQFFNSFCAKILFQQI